MKKSLHLRRYDGKTFCGRRSQAIALPHSDAGAVCRNCAAAQARANTAKGPRIAKRSGT